MGRERLIYQEKYKKNSMRIKDECLPVLRNVPSDMVAESAEIKEAGIIERDGIRQEYQVIRVVFHPTTGEDGQQEGNPAGDDGEGE